MTTEYELKTLHAAIQSVRQMLNDSEAGPSSAPEAEDTAIHDVKMLIPPELQPVVQETLRHLMARVDHLEAAVRARSAEMSQWLSRFLAWETLVRALEESLAKAAHRDLRLAEDAQLERKQQALLERFAFASEEQFGPDRAELVMSRTRLLKALEPVLGIPRDAISTWRVLDLDSGRGESLEALIAAGFAAATGIDNNDEMVLECRRHGLAVTRDDALHALATLPDCSLDLVCGWTLGGSMDIAGMLSMANEARRVLAPGGSMVVGGVVVAPDTVATGLQLEQPGAGRVLTRQLMSFAVRFLDFAEIECETGDDAADSVPGSIVIARKPGGQDPWRRFQRCI